jgi:hypothetical protein
MTRLEQLEFRMLTRRIAAVVEYFDDEGTPWSYVQRTGDGRFEAITTLVQGDEACELSLGFFTDCAAARATVCKHVREVNARALDTDFV